MSSFELRIILTSVDRALTSAWREFCGDLDGVEIEHCSILDVRCDAVVSPANSFGFMDGGIDLIYSDSFGWGVQQSLQDRIREYHHGELLVGNAEIVETGSDVFPYLIAAPTMRVPMPLSNSPNPYLATRAALLLVRHGKFRVGSRAGEPISTVVGSVAFPGMGTGIGELDPRVCARQVRQAIREVVFGGHEFPRSWIAAQEQHYELVRPVTPGFEPRESRRT